MQDIINEIKTWGSSYSISGLNLPQIRDVCEQIKRAYDADLESMAVDIINTIDILNEVSAEMSNGEYNNIAWSIRGNFDNLCHLCTGISCLDKKSALQATAAMLKHVYNLG